MKTSAQATWDQTLELACDTFKVLARNRLRSGAAMTVDGWYDLAAETAERAAPRREAALLAILQSCPRLMARPLAEPTHSLAEAAFQLISDTLRDEVTGRLNSLKAEIAGRRGAPSLQDALRLVRDLAADRACWNLFLPRLTEAFELQMTDDLEAGLLPDLIADRAGVARYIERFAKQALPEELDQIVMLIASSPDLAVRAPAQAQTFEGCAELTLQAAAAEHLVDVFRSFWDTHRALAA